MSEAAHALVYRSLASARFTDVDLAASTVDDVSLRAAAFTNVSLADATFRNVSFRNATIDDSDVVGMKIDGVLVSDLMLAYRRSHEA